MQRTSQVVERRSVDRDRPRSSPDARTQEYAMRDDQRICAITRRWVETVVVGLELCPFAARELEAGRVRFAASRATTESALLEDLAAELQRLDDEGSIETTLLIHPAVLQDFLDYNDFLDAADALLEKRNRVGIYQIASFHPDYRFADSAPDAPENATNRSPLPMLHVLREASVERAVDRHPDPDGIPERNIARMRALGATRLAELLRACEEPV
jgi:hypothetical protein